jgi:predicted lipoprotein with Yx(FWY)xxD motif
VSKISYASALLAIAAVLALAGCGSSGDGSGYGNNNSTGGSETSSGGSETRYGGSPAGGSPATSSAIVSVGSAPKLGRILVDSKDFTLYDFHKDKGGKSACYGGCAAVWPPLLTEGKPQPSNGAAAAKLGIVKRSDGTTQVTYAGHPLYTYTADSKPGDAKGNDIDAFGAEWYALEPSGQEP